MIIMYIRNTILFSMVAGLLFAIINVEIRADSKVTISYRSTHIPFSSYNSLQSDINHKLFLVINTEQDWLDFITNTPSLESPVPLFDEKLETAVIYVSKAVTCEYFPYVISVTHQEWLDVLPIVENIEVSVVHEADLEAENVNCIPSEKYVTNIVFFEKTSLPVSLDVMNGL